MTERGAGGAHGRTPSGAAFVFGSGGEPAARAFWRGVFQDQREIWHAAYERREVPTLVPFATLNDLEPAREDVTEAVTFRRDRRDGRTVRFHPGRAA